MKKTKLVTTLLIAIMLLAVVASGCSGDRGDTTADGKVVLPISNLYISNLDDAYSDWLQDKFNVKITGRNYSWADWDQQVTSAVNADNLSGAFHWNLTSRNFPTMKRWASGGSLRAVPDDLSKYPNVKRLVDNATALEYMKVDGKLYGLPILSNPANLTRDTSEFTYIYRKDWVKKLALSKPDAYGHLYKEDDVYTLTEFYQLLEAFKSNDSSLAGNGKTIALADVEWAFPSVINYYKTAPHAYTFDEAQNKFVWSYTLPEFTQGLNKAKQLVDNNIYWADQYSSKEGGAFAKFKSGVVGVYFDNCTLSNYATIRRDFATNNPTANVDEATSLMRLKTDEGKFVYEGTENWWSATFFAAEMTDKQMDKFFEIMDWLLSEEGTEFCTYGFKDIDYTKSADGEIEVLWTKRSNGEYAPKNIGPMQLRHAVSLNHDILLNTPSNNVSTVAAYKSWTDDIARQKDSGQVYILPLYPQMNWLSTPEKDRNGNLLTLAQSAIVEHVFGKGGWDTFNTNNASKYNAVLAEINSALNYN